MVPSPSRVVRGRWAVALWELALFVVAEHAELTEAILPEVQVGVVEDAPARLVFFVESFDESGVGESPKPRNSVEHMHTCRPHPVTQVPLAQIARPRQFFDIAFAGDWACACMPEAWQLVHVADATALAAR